MTMMRTKNHLLELILLGLLLLSPLLACDHDLLADNNMDLVKDAMKRRTLNVGNGNRNLQAAKPSKY